MTIKNSKIKKRPFWIWIILIVLFFIIVFYFFETDEIYETSIKTRTLREDGFCVLYDETYSKQSKYFPCDKLRDDTLDMLPEGYVFIDYVYKINNVALSTFHRDVTSSKNIYKTSWPVYTMILYKYEGELLSVCPRSNETYPFVWSSIVNIQGRPGTVFIFDSDLLHSGCVNRCKKRQVIQYKLCHRSDLSKLGHLHGIRKTKTDVCQDDIYGMVMRKLSYYFEMPINYYLYPLMIKREDENSILGKIQSVIPLTYYNT